MRLDGFAETPVALSTAGVGTFTLHVDRADHEIDYWLTYDALEGVVSQAHIHFGSPSQSGGVANFPCTNLGKGPGGTQACPTALATATAPGTLRPADVVGPTAQGISAGEFDELAAAIKPDTTYVNVHTSLYPTGEIRSQQSTGTAELHPADTSAGGQPRAGALRAQASRRRRAPRAWCAPPCRQRRGRCP